MDEDTDDTDTDPSPSVLIGTLLRLEERRTGSGFDADLVILFISKVLFFCERGSKCRKEEILCLDVLFLNSCNY